MFNAEPAELYLFSAVTEHHSQCLGASGQSRDLQEQPPHEASRLLRGRHRIVRVE
jgi:hypothetical protein